MKINDVLSGLLIGSFGAAIYLHARSFPPLPGQNVGPNMFPQLIATGLMICAMFLVFRGVKTLGTEGWITLPGWLGQGRIALGFLLIPLVLVFYVAVSESLGFLPTAVILLMTLFLVFKVRLRTAIVVAVLGALCIHTLFYKLLKVPLPWGLLKSVAW
ncbi:tripartite tricarboxylate transporter TctB family protein [Rhodoferax sp.]|jgi:putative tricarboxylic transport membrane protein|uniref:tripartite tricarboxylate transporter TctB family protein n=1 Tax=Rhodoferax sp. TaxID=50421 RepID=UPI002722DA5A|nr:tripartite tricarboxylate transporter TctB family protein [Rhodoferax sp.]MDO9143798.1 tripartite tricarboxylate transporter TctB family protein [Rhodoferax sp.]MDP1531044.1 tripartite tricarboxylate transporter TctB family protein [Rhodoferax sp.]MDP1945061.1 tripartite tricarboxylate transporter TctB family protein [Rhodoferax sp.]MDP2442335.1 tripartite tricarboxylate transporter TctB family protein [Rhodoferax sp.]MDP3193065.1 tripartite tricarboxylate transporter TctB family protein [R